MKRLILCALFSFTTLVLAETTAFIRLEATDHDNSVRVESGFVPAFKTNYQVWSGRSYNHKIQVMVNRQFKKGYHLNFTKFEDIRSDILKDTLKQCFQLRAQEPRKELQITVKYDSDDIFVNGAGQIYVHGDKIIALRCMRKP